MPTPENLVETWQKMLGGLAELASGAEGQAVLCEEHMRSLVTVAEALLALLPDLTVEQAGAVAVQAERVARLAGALAHNIDAWRIHRDAWAALSQWRPGP